MVPLGAWRWTFDLLNPSCFLEISSLPYSEFLEVSDVCAGKILSITGALRREPLKMSSKGQNIRHFSAQPVAISHSVAPC